MIITCEEFDIDKIARSGQCFRINCIEDGVFGLVHAGEYLEVAQKDKNTIELSCGPEQYEKLWRQYFDMDTDYTSIISQVDPEDEYLVQASEYGSGIRILRQDPWEMIISFIISQRKSIPAIKTSIERLCRMCGDKIETDRGELYSFPSAEKLVTLSEAQLNECGMGYRGKYISGVARKVVEGELDVYDMDRLSDEELRAELLGLYGVGVKVANCVMLFGYHRIDSFPEDVWIKRALENHYPDGFPYKRYPDCAGVMQQYLFFYSRNEQV